MNVQVFFWANNAYNAVVLTDGERWIVFDEEFDGIDLYGENVISELSEYIKNSEFNSFLAMYSDFSADASGMSPTVGINFGAEFDRGELTHIGMICE